MSIDPLAEVEYRYRLALQHLGRAERMYRIGDWPSTVRFAQLAIENFTKSLIAIFEIPTWSHDPSNQLMRLREKFPKHMVHDVEELANITREVAPEHDRSTYGEPSRGLTPDDVYNERHVLEILSKAKRARDIVKRMLKEMKVYP